MEVPHGLFILSVALLISHEGPVCASQDIHITPAKPLVKLGNSLTLNCSVSCLPGKPKWNILTDSTSATMIDDNQYSIMNITNVEVDDTTFGCEAKCGEKKPRATVKLYYFSVLNISADPEELMSGQQFQLKCTVDVHPIVMVKLKLKSEETEMATQTKCQPSEDGRFKHCEVAKLTEATQARYHCEATLQVENSQVTETALLEGSMSTIKATSPPTGPPSTAALQTEGVTVQTKQTYVQSTAAFKEAPMNKNSPLKATSPPADPLSTESLDTEEVPVQTERPRVQSTTAFKEPTTVNKFSPDETTSPTSAGPKVEAARSSSSSQAVVISVPLLISLILATGIGLFYCLKKRKCQEKPEGETCPPQCS